MTDDTPLLPLISDDVLQLLHLLASSGDGFDGTGQGTKLTEVIHHQACPVHLNTQHAAKSATDNVAKELSRLASGKIDLLQAAARRGTFATPECLALRPALEAIAQGRAATREAVQRERQLEWLRLATSIDRQPLRIGAYQAHAERFLATAGQRMVKYFPWLPCTVEVEENRQRNKSTARGIVRDRFDEGYYDFMLVPRHSETAHTDYIYDYSFRVIGTAEKLEELRDADGVIDRAKLRGETLIVGAAHTSTRQRVRELLLDVGINIEEDQAKLIEDPNPASMRLRAVTGEGLAIISDEYTMVGASRMGFPYLGLGPDGAQHRQRKHEVEMGLLRHDDADQPRHQAFRFVISELVKEEATCARAAAQD